MNQKSQVRRYLAIAGAAGFVISVVAVAIGLLLGPGKDSQPGTQPQKAAETKTEATGPTPTERSRTKQLDGFEEVDPVKFDASGIAKMQVTSDPRIAAASAAQVLTSVDTSKTKWAEDFREEAVARVMRPTPEYSGPGDGLIVTNLHGETKNGDDLIADTAKMLAAEEYSPEGWWWMLGDARQFQSFVSYGATLKSQAIEVYNEAEMTEYSDGASWTSPSSAFSLNIDPEASFELYWVRVQTETLTGKNVVETRNPVALAIYCDPPAQGGVCGVSGLMTKYPSGWKTNY